MLAIAALKIGLRCHIYAPEAEAPAHDAAMAKTVAAYDDEAALAAFADAVDVITYEFENVPTATVEFLSERKPVRPAPRALALTQDRLVEKTFLRDLGLETAPFVGRRRFRRARARGRRTRPPLDPEDAPLRLRRQGPGDDPRGLGRRGGLHRTLGGGPMILEGFVAFEREVSVVAARSLEGAVVAYDLCENEHERHILARTRLPAHVEPGIEAEGARKSPRASSMRSTMSG